MKTSFLFILAFFGLSTLSTAGTIQLDSIGIEEIDGKKFIIHKVSDNETLYSLSRRYNVSIYQIIENNPTTEFGLEIGTLVKIPIVEKKKQEPVKEAKSIDLNTEKPPKQKRELYHEVMLKETLFSISKQYGVTIEDIKEWNDLTDDTIALGQRLIIKKGTEDLKEPARTGIVGKTHIVEPSETLYSLSKKYNATVEELKEWNDLMSNEISIGQELVVAKDSSSQVENAVSAKKDSVRKTADTLITVDTTRDTSIVYRPIENPVINASDSGFEEIIESGLAALIEGSDDTRKYLALHRTAKVGTIMRVTNEMNGQEVFVRVLGKLPDTGINKNIVIRISKSAYNRLGAIDPKFRVKVSYLP